MESDKTHIHAAIRYCTQNKIFIVFWINIIGLIMSSAWKNVCSSEAIDSGLSHNYSSLFLSTVKLQKYDCMSVVKSIPHLPMLAEVIWVINNTNFTQTRNDNIHIHLFLSLHVNSAITLPEIHWTSIKSMQIRLSYISNNDTN